MVNRTTLRNLAKQRLKAAKILFHAGDFDTAGYLLGYVVECGLKAMICKRLNLTEYPDTGKHMDVFASHALDRLLVLSGYSSEIDLTKNPNLFDNWSKLTGDWKPEIRYTQGAYTKNIIARKITALEDSTDGLLAWFRKGRW
jgi:hypothetical protein